MSHANVGHSDVVAEPRVERGWLVVAAQELRDLWVGGKGPLLLFGYSVLLSVLTYVSATSAVLNFLEQREAVSLVLQVAVAVGVLMAMVAGADTISGERERGTLESLLLTPVSRRGILVGKLMAALSLWLGAFVMSLPYLWVLGHDVGVLGPAAALGLTVGTLLALGLAAAGVLVSTVASSNKVSLAVGMFVLLALFAPTQVPGGLPRGWIGDVLTWANPVDSGMRYLAAVLVSDHRWSADLGYLVAPGVTALAVAGVLLAVGPRILRLRGGVSAG